MNAVPEPPLEGGDTGATVTPIRKGAEKLLAGVAEATRTLKPPARDLDAAMQDLRVPDELLAALFSHGSDLGLVVDSEEVQDGFGGDISASVTVVRCDGKEVYLLNIEGFVLDNPSRENSGAIRNLESMFPPGAVISIMSRDLPQGPHDSFETMWKTWESKSGLKVFYVTWRSLNDLAKHDYRASEVAEKLHLTEILTASSGPAKAAGRVPLRIFLSYAPADDEYRRELEKALSALEREELIKLWAKPDLRAGDDREREVAESLDAAEIILLLVSPDFLDAYLASDELARAMARHEAGARVVPVLIRQSDWETAPFGRLTPVPTNRMPVADWATNDQAWIDVVKALRALVSQ